jgi:hypothetical protein
MIAWVARERKGARAGIDTVRCASGWHRYGEVCVASAKRERGLMNNIPRGYCNFGALRREVIGGSRPAPPTGGLPEKSF